LFGIKLSIDALQLFSLYYKYSSELDINREFTSIPPRPGIYAIRHKTDGLLYIGKTKSLRSRFSGGHKAFL
ncbi:GIY-YIG nuclease family protein, partial [Chlorogloeopsis fritschii]